MPEPLEIFMKKIPQRGGATIFFNEMPDPERFVEHLKKIRPPEKEPTHVVYLNPSHDVETAESVLKIEKEEKAMKKGLTIAGRVLSKGYAKRSEGAKQRWIKRYGPDEGEHLHRIYDMGNRLALEGYPGNYVPYFEVLRDKREQDEVLKALREVIPKHALVIIAPAHTALEKEFLERLKAHYKSVHGENFFEYGKLPAQFREFKPAFEEPKKRGLFSGILGKGNPV